eukprot:s1151_g19.t1
MYILLLLQLLRDQAWWARMEARLAALEELVEDQAVELRFLRSEVARLRRRPVEAQSGARGSASAARESRTPSSEDLSFLDPPAIHLEVPRPRPSTGNPGSSTGPTSSATPLSWTQREAICDQIAEFILRALSGDHRRTSGREQIKLGSRVWIVFRDFDGYEHNPVTICRNFAACRSLVKRGSDCGESVFIGLPSDREARREDRTVLVEDSYLRAWVGYITEETYSALDTLEIGDTVDYAFKVDGQDGFLPACEGVAEALREHFAFLSAESGEQEEPQEPDLQDRVSKLEELMQGVAENVKVLVSSQPSAKVAKERGATARQVTFDPAPVTIARKVEGRADRFQGLDPGVVAAALNAGVSDENLSEMQRLLSIDPAGAKRLREPALRRSGAKAKTKAAPVNHLSESEDEEAQVEEDGIAPQAEEEPTVAGALYKLTALLGALSEDKLKRSSKSKIDQALDSAAGSSQPEGASMPGLKRASAARRALRTALADSPEEISAVIERLMLEDLLCQTQVPNMPMQVLNPRAWLEHRSRVTAYKTGAHCAWGVGGILGDLINGRIAHARARAGLLMLQLDQCAIDKGNWALAAELSLEQGPPFAALSLHQPPSINDGEAPFSRLLEPRWCEVMLAHLKDSDEYVARRRNLARRLVDEPASEAVKAVPKAKTKGKKGSDEPANE